jgi:hypothetical protein
MSGLQPIFKGELLELTEVVFRYRAVDNSVTYFETFGVFVNYKNQNPLASKVRFKLKIDGTEKAPKYSPCPYGSECDIYENWDLDPDISESDYPATTFIPAWSWAKLPYGTNWLTLSFSLLPNRARIILFRNTTAVPDKVFVKKNGKIWSSVGLAFDTDYGRLAFSFFNTSNTTKSYSFYLQSEKGKVEYALSANFGVEAYKTKNIKLEIVEVDDNNNVVSQPTEINKTLKILSIALV